MLRLLLVAAAATATIVPVSVYGPAEDVIEGGYLVQFRSDAKAQFESFKTSAFAASGSVSIMEIGENDFMAFSAKLSQSELEQVQQMDGVMTIEPDMVAHLYGEQTGVQAYGIDRVDQRTGLNQIYRWRDNAAGQNTFIYILDTGIDTRHPEFEGRASFLSDCVSSNPCRSTNDPLDPQGHGTHCAGSAGSRAYGVAKNATIYNVRVMGPSGTGPYSDIIRGVEFVANHRAPGQKIASMSLGGGRSTILDNAVNAAHRSGTPVVAAAGNSNSDACNGSPSGAANAITVSSSTRSDTKAGTSSWGACVQIYAPGDGILSTYPNNRAVTISGTSMACPHVAGALALIASRPDHQGANPDRLLATLLAEATPDVIRNNRGATPNRLLFTNPQ